MPLHLVPSDELRSACRQKIESCELWLRRMVHDCLRAEFGETYIQDAQLNGHYIFRSEIRKYAMNRLAAQPGQYRRQIDTLLLDHLVSIICKPDIFRKYFSDPLSWSFPNGNEPLRTVLNRLVTIRNSLSHANPLTLHDAERVLCYCDDVIYSLVHFYADQGMTNEFNAPLFTRFSDCYGHSELLQSSKNNLNYTDSRALRAGDSIRLEVEVDAHFPPDDYTVNWVVANISSGERGLGLSFCLTLLPRHVGETFAVQATVISNKSWHRHSDHDAYLTVSYKVLPPI